MSLPLQHKNIIVAVSGSIAAYKSAILIRLLIKNGANVKVLMTDNATKFISPLTLSTLSKNPVLISVIEETNWNNHVELGLWADAMIIAPATANTIAKIANGLCDSIIAAVYLSARCKVYIAPAMDVDMWHHSATNRNIELLKKAKNKIIPVGNGELASGLVGDGRMAEPEVIVELLLADLQRVQDFKNKKVLITAGPTYEAIDPVRFIGNRSTGKMGISIANEFLERGAEVTLVLGPSTQKIPINEKLKVIRIQSAQEMFENVQANFSDSNIVVLTAAVADYRPRNVADQKIKKKDDELQLEFVKTIDIAATIGKQKSPHQRIVGFALETNNELAFAQEKLKKKNFDLIVLNSLKDVGAGFSHDTNKITIIDSKNNILHFELKSKDDVAIDIVNAVKQLD
ncbi:MAG: bifunctional phosphopantothenoylcysteine decarboxylase/phosphopantothenate--cysteine ligase CoaBC [Saprospiraceae bacterium]|nr:bifunctional phosphopantothenoylcysteine decarboxylase/phosphopantothenate--cysteine ligase CoaBC [Saprospiraceae bacterium]